MRSSRRLSRQPADEAQRKKVIGIFDSGVGGLSVFREVRLLLPDRPVIYVGDQAHVPYGPRKLEEVRDFSFEISRWLMSQGCTTIVVACNTASAAALHELRDAYPQTNFVGMEPAVKPAAEQTRSGVVGVLATPATFQGKLYTSVVERFAKDVKIYTNTCPGLVAEIEAGRLDGDATRRILTDALTPMLAAGIDTVVLGCTHYPFVIPLIREIVGESVRVIDPAPAVARQVARLASGSLSEYMPEPRVYTTGEPDAVEFFIRTILGIEIHVEKLVWQEGHLEG